MQPRDTHEPLPLQIRSPQWQVPHGVPLVAYWTAQLGELLQDQVAQVELPGQVTTAPPPHAPAPSHASP